MRELLHEDRTYYVHSCGDDENDGRNSGPEGAFRSWQRAVGVVAELDLNGKTVTIQHCVEPAATVFTEPVQIPPLLGGGELRIAGSPMPGGTIFDVPIGCWTVNRCGQTTVGFQSMTLRGGGSGLINVQSGATIAIRSGMVFGPAAFSHIYVHDSISLAYILNAEYSITGNASYHLFVNGGMLFMEEMAVALEGERSFPGGFACAINGGKIQTVTTTFTGTSTGPRFSVTANGVINTFLGPEAGAEYFPGSWEGHTSTGGQYL